MANAGPAAIARRRIAWLALGLAACGPASGPQPIVYDREPCAHCRMLISEPRFAAQLETQDGEIRSFDDPGCLLADLAAHAGGFRALWFHHVREDRWLDARTSAPGSGAVAIGYRPLRWSRHAARSRRRSSAWPPARSPGGSDEVVGSPPSRLDLGEVLRSRWLVLCLVLYGCSAACSSGRSGSRRARSPAGVLFSLSRARALPAATGPAASVQAKSRATMALSSCSYRTRSAAAPAWPASRCAFHRARPAQW
jgi:hypothetical protein